MGGTLEATSQLGQGSIFKLALPMKEIQKPVTDPYASHALLTDQKQSSRVKGQHGTPLGRILLVEDWR